MGYGYFCQYGTLGRREEPCLIACRLVQIKLDTKNFDKTEAFKERIESPLKAVRIMGKKNKIPFLLSFVIKNTEKKTEYRSYINTSPDLIGNMSQDIIPDCVNVMFCGFKPVKYNVMEDDVENHVAESKTAIGNASPNKNRNMFDLTDVFSADLEPAVEEINKVCKEAGIPFLMCFALKDDGEKTEYKTYSYTPPERMSVLTRDSISTGLKVIMEGCVSAVADLEEDVFEGAVPWSGSEEAKK